MIDCNNFYASCERVFNSKLEGKPIGILSNNDGCVIARSNELKPLVPMGMPAHQIPPPPRKFASKLLYSVAITNFMAI
ncbi:hypothetical protein [Gilliamella sp. BG7]|uniref:Y-family DNA polymerase n=1 Tax=unclassified Gilliamella TaxID=2685620 RepID=UPI003987F034